MLRQPVVRDGEWRLLECVPGVGRQLDVGRVHRVVLGGPGAARRLVTVNYAGNQGQCYVRLPFSDLSDRSVRLEDLLSPARYDRAGRDLVSRGLYLDLGPWGHHVFDLVAG